MYEYRARCLNVVDGDTIDVLVDLGLRTYQTHRIRLAHVDTPERGQDGFREAKEFTETFCGVRYPLPQADADWPLVIRTIKPADKYGRWLAEVWSDDQSLHELLVARNLARWY
jgi:micrococcal nuclease